MSPPYMALRDRFRAVAMGMNKTTMVGDILDLRTP